MERKLACWLLIVTIFVVIFALYPNNRSSILTKEFGYVAASGLLSLLAAGAIAFGRPINSRIGFPLLAAFALALGWMVFRQFTGINSVNGPKVIYAFAALGLTAGAGGMLLGARERDTVLWGLMAGTLLLGIYTILQWLNVIVFPWDVFLGVSGRLSGSLGNPNLLGSYMASILPAGVAFLLTRRMRPAPRSALAAAFAGLCLLCIVSSGTRGSMLGLLAGAGLLGILLSLRAKGRGLRRFVPLGVALVGILAIFVFMKSRFLELADTGHGTARVRLVIWSGGLSMFADKPLTGWGPGSFQIVFPQYRNPRYNLMGTSHNTEHAHSEYIEILTDTGLIGFALLGLLGWQIARAVRRREADLLTLGLMVGCISLLVEASVSVSLRWPPSAFLLALFIGLLLAGARESERRVRRLWAAPLLGAACFIGTVEIPDYIRSMESGHLLFVGKDIYLDRIETDLNRAGSAALTWEQTGDVQARTEALNLYAEASVLCDSSVSWLQRCVRLNPSELGGWYGLGSAWLTKAIIIQPASQPLLRLLQNQTGYVPNRQEILGATLRALAAYDSLTARAPDYAEVHNNLSLTYTRLGMPEETMRSLRRAYELHVHRRGDYLMQAVSIGPLGGWFDAGHFIWMAILEGMEPDSSSGAASRPGAQVTASQWFSGLAMASFPRLADSLAASLSEAALASGLPSARLLPASLAMQAGYALSGQEILDSWLSGDTAGLAARADSEMQVAGVVLPSQFLVRHLIGAERGEDGAVDSLLLFGRHLLYDGFLWTAFSPGGNYYLDAALEASIAGSVDSSTVGATRVLLLRSLRAALDMDNSVSKLVLISRTDFHEGVSPQVASELERRWAELGGPQAAADQAQPDPWVEGSIFGRCLDTLDGLVAARPGDAELLCTRIAVDYEILSSFWWGLPRFTEEFRNYFLTRIDADRRTLDTLLGSEEAVYRCAQLMQQVDAVTSDAISSEFAPFLERLRLDITNNRVLLAGESPTQP